jgi:hypothetical protein
MTARNESTGPTLDELLTALVGLLQHGNGYAKDTESALSYLQMLGLCSRDVIGEVTWTEAAQPYEAWRRPD